MTEVERLRRWAALWKRAAKNRFPHTPYCPTCGACGEPGCCPPNRCHLICLYGKSYKKHYDELVKENQELYNELHNERGYTCD